MFCLMVSSCQTSIKENAADLILHSAYVYPVAGSPIENGAVAIAGGKIIAVGPTKEILTAWKSEETELIDAKGNFLMPGFIEGHGHFSSLGMSLINVNLLHTQSWEEIIDSVEQRVKKAKPGEWIIGRGWHQEKWTSRPEKEAGGYPYHDQLSAISPQNPVILSHASGHSIMVNLQAMDLSGVSAEMPDPPGGHILRDASGHAIGVFEERAMDVIFNAYNEYESKLQPSEKNQLWQKAIRLAQDHCLQYGITSFQDAGSSFDEIHKYSQLADHDSLDLRLWAMLRHPYEELKGHLEGFPVLKKGDDMFTCRAIKSETDGALGSYGAWLLEPYDDKPGFTGQNTTLIQDVKGIAALCIQNQMQLCVHSIGDKGNQVTLDIFEEAFKSTNATNNLRWRVEHAQHLDPADISRFKELGVIASMQAIHCISDAPFVVKRIGEKRAKEGAYAWRSLLDSGAVIANGTDAPVESVDPLPCIYASVTRKRPDNGMEFFPEQKMTRTEALYSYTMANAYAAFEDDVKGSLEKGKWADMVLLSKNLSTCTDNEIPAAKVLMTIVGGEVKYRH